MIRSIPAALLLSLCLLAAPVVGAPATASGAVVCADGVGAARGSFAHDPLTATPAVKASVEREVAAETRARRARSARTGADPLPAQIVVPVRIHIIHGKHARDRAVTRNDARKMFYTLRAGFNGAQDPTMTPTGIRFELRPISVTRNDRWFHASPGSKADREMHRSLHSGVRRSLNIYLNNLTFDGGTLLGIARFPWLAGAYPLLDGVTINVESLPGGRARGYNLGDTVIHETGHWFGLFHTFEGGCESPGDYVNDTAPEAEPSFECDLTRDTCPTDLPAGWVEGDPEPEPVLDPVRNFMDYSYDTCMNHFTPDQRTRAVTLFMRYRYGR
ncbi:MAG: zinc metalloprotease [Propionibacteriales bacterium]|nr:zinc metalloprotease [Propionibacteriales bacterium]